MASPVLETQQESSSTFTNSLTVVLPSGVAAGDMILLCGAQDAADGVEVPTGYTQVYQGTASTSMTMAAFYKLAGSSESNPTWDVSDASSEGISVLAVRISGWDEAAPVQSNNIVTGNVTTRDSPDATATGDCLVIRHLGIAHGNVVSLVNPDTLVANFAPSTSSAVVTTGVSQKDDGTGAVGAGTWSWTSPSDRAGGGTIIVHGGGGGGGSTFQAAWAMNSNVVIQ